jgi:hypothetical protein
MTKHKLPVKPRKKLTLKKQLIKRSKKSNPISLIVLVSAIIVFGSYSLYKSMIKPLGINEVGSPSSTSCSQGFTDNFDSNSINLSNWTIINNATGDSTDDSLNTTNGQLVEKVNFTSPNWRGRSVQTTKSFHGDFITEVDVIPSTLSVDNDTQLVTQIVVRDADLKNGVVLLREKTGLIKSYQIINGDTTGIGMTEVPNVDPNATIRFKIIKTGDKAKMYYKNTTQSEFVFIKEFSGLPQDTPSLRLTTTGHGNAIGIGKFDNFTFGCIPENKPPVPSNPRSTCNPDGKSVRLMWDGVDSANSYKVRVDDKAGKVTPFDGINKTEYIANITPNQTYSWWAHATKNGVDSAETSRLEFRCTPTSTPTPTPKPTVKPTIAPTVTPTISPTATPTNSTYVAPTTTQAQTFDLPVEPISSPLPTKSTNPISRFFSWLASLFE